MAFWDRQALLQILFEHIAEPSRILLNKRIKRVDHGDDSVTVHCADGSSYTGDVLVGADGVFSTVQQEMWRLAEVAELPSNADERVYPLSAPDFTVNWPALDVPDEFQRFLEDPEVG